MKAVAAITAACLSAALWCAPGAAAQSAYDEAEEAFGAYDFDRAASLLDSYAKKRRKGPTEADMTLDWRGEPADRVALLRDRIEQGRNMLLRVEDIEVVDSLTVPADLFFRRYVLSGAAGTLRPADSLGDIAPRGWETDDPVYVTEEASRVVWAGRSSADAPTAMYGGLLLADGSWTAPEQLFTRASIFGDGIDGQVATPWLMPDGMTLYFAADGPESLGGLDIYIARQADDGTFLQPSNLGMPYNSEANDFALAIDEETGAGWWATDRNSPDGTELTVYVFAPAELRVNLSPDDTPDLASRARLASIAATRKSGSDAAARIGAALRAALDEAQAAARPEAAPEFELPLPDGRVLTRSSQIVPVDARALLPRYKELLRQVEGTQATLDSLRDRYAAGERSLAQRILALEVELTSAQNALEQTRSQLLSHL